MSSRLDLSLTAPMNTRWRRWLLVGLGPTLVVGFLASAVADRPAFLAWALAAGAAYAFALHRSFTARPALALAVLAAGWVVLGVLVVRHREALGLGIAALMPAEAAP